MSYRERKERARQEAIEWQHGFADHSYSYGELAVFQAHFEKSAARYGLTEEFRDNGII